MKRIKIAFMAMLIFITFLFSACRGNVAIGDKGFVLYYINPEGTGLESMAYTLKESKANQVGEILKSLSSAPSEQDFVAPLSDLKVKQGDLKDNILSLQFGAEYKTLPAQTEVLVRAAVAKTLLQLDGVDAVEFYVSKEPLLDANGAEVGRMTVDSFLDYFGKEQGDVLFEDMVLYYATADGMALKKKETRVYFDTKMSLEQAVLSCISQNPETENAKSAFIRSLYPATVTTSDGVCYVDLDINFIIQAEGVSPDVVIYSIVNSLCELSNVHTVRLNVISMDDSMEKEAKELSGSYEMNTDIILQD